MSGAGTNPNVATTALYNPTATEIITTAYRIAGIINEDETPTAGMFREAMTALNSMLKQLEQTGLHVWTQEEAILFLQPLQARYLLGGTSTPDHCCDANLYTLGTLASSVAAGATSVTLEDSDGFVDGYQFGILMDDGYVFWTTVDGEPVGDVVTLASAITGAAGAGNNAYAYETNIVRPLRVPFSRRLAFSGQILTPLRMMSRREYFDLPNPLSEGTPTQAFYNPARDQGEYYVWPVVNAGSLQNSNAMRFTWYRPLQDFLTVDNTADMPSEWMNCLFWSLAKELGPRYSVPAERMRTLQENASAMLELAEGWDREPEDIYFGLDADESVRR